MSARPAVVSSRGSGPDLRLGEKARESRRDRLDEAVLRGIAATEAIVATVLMRVYVQ